MKDTQEMSLHGTRLHYRNLQKNRITSQEKVTKRVIGTKEIKDI